MSFEDAQKEVRNILRGSLEKIVKHLLDNYKGEIDILRGNRGKYIRNGILSKSGNDFRDYFWIKVMVGENGYCLTMFYDDICPVNGSHRHQNGKIQFRKSKNNNDVNPPSKENNYICSFRPELTHDPKMKVGKGFNARIVAEAFIEYIKPVVK